MGELPCPHQAHATARRCPHCSNDGTNGNLLRPGARYIVSFACSFSVHPSFIPSNKSNPSRVSHNRDRVHTVLHGCSSMNPNEPIDAPHPNGAFEGQIRVTPCSNDVNIQRASLLQLSSITIMERFNSNFTAFFACSRLSTTNADIAHESGSDSLPTHCFVRRLEHCTLHPHVR